MKKLRDLLEKRNAFDEKLEEAVDFLEDVKDKMTHIVYLNYATIEAIEIILEKKDYGNDTKESILEFSPYLKTAIDFYKHYDKKKLEDMLKRAEELDDFFAENFIEDK